jgi:membrane peptidoglycan carboxypeptidase
MQPRLVREIRDADGGVLERFGSRVIRRVIDKDVAAAVSAALVGVVEDGTGTSARLASFTVAGKSGTARMNLGDGYEQGAYYSSFVGFFPAEAPQLVVFVGLDRPQGAYYGGAVAAPVTRATMEAALAARATPLDRRALLRSARREEVMPATNLTPARFASSTAEPETASEIAPAVAEVIDRTASVSLPNVAGLPSRVAVRRLHALGLRVSSLGTGTIIGTEPRAGERVQPGDTIRLRLGAD